MTHQNNLEASSDLTGDPSEQRTMFITPMELPHLPRWRGPLERGAADLWLEGGVQLVNCKWNLLSVSAALN